MFSFLRFWFPVLFTALVLRLIAVFYWEASFGSAGLYFGDSNTYWVLAQTIADGSNYEYNGELIMRMPGYPVLLAPLFWFFGGDPPIIAARILGAIIGTCSVAVATWISQILFQNRFCSHISAWFCAIEPLNTALSPLILSETPFCFVMLLQLAFWILAIQSGKKQELWRLIGFGIASGFFFAAAVYVRPSWFYFVPFALLLGLFIDIIKRSHLFPYFCSGMVSLLIFAICMSPWWIRNYQLTGTFVPTTLQMGASLYDGLRPDADGSSDMDFVSIFREAEKHTGLSGIRLEQRMNEQMQNAAINWAKNHPEIVFRLVAKKFLRLWNFWPNEATFSRLSVKIILLIVYIPILVFALIGVVRSFWQDETFWILWIPAIYLTFLHVIFVSSLRYRAPALFGFSILAAWILCATFCSIQTRQNKQ
ncbi:MAG: ArnT family glycosyltransferase [Thermoguttaceae bacterium]